jgi:hypothetical protein
MLIVSAAEQLAGSPMRWPGYGSGGADMTRAGSRRIWR